MKDAFKRICELQPLYSPDNTPEMQERGALLRGSVKPALERLQPLLSKALGRFGKTFGVSASDGIGRKTELPWVRFCSEEMSPSPTEGFYSVIHFATDGTAVHVTVGCGSSKWHKGSAVTLPDKELDLQTAWARRVVMEELGTLDPFVDAPDYGATRKLPVSFQRATAFSKRVPFKDIDSTDFERLLEKAAERLRVIYTAQAIGRDLTQADQAEGELGAILSPRRAETRRQGFRLSADARKAIEMRAMAMAETYLKDAGYAVKDCSANESYDFEAKRDGKVIKVEVKGTTSDVVDAILMTSNEVALHQNHTGNTALLIVSQIRLYQHDGKHQAEGGILEAFLGWDISEWTLEPTAYRVSKKR